MRGDDPELLELRMIVAAHVPAIAKASDPDLHILADRKRVEPSEIIGANWVFDIPANTKAVSLVSHACKPSTLGLAADDRNLGFCVTAIRATSAASDAVLAPTNQLLQEGFHQAEREGFRWTDGRATLPIELLGGGTCQIRLTVTGHGLPYYIHQRDAA